MEIHPPPDWIARIRRLICSDGEVTVFHSSLNRSAKLSHVSHLCLVDFFYDGSNLDTGIVGARTPDHFEYGNALCSFEFQFFLDILVHISNDYAELFSQSPGFIHGHRFLILRAHRCRRKIWQGSHTQADTQNKGPSTAKGLCMSTD